MAGGVNDIVPGEVGGAVAAKARCSAAGRVRGEGEGDSERTAAVSAVEEGFFINLLAIL